MRVMASLVSLVARAPARVQVKLLAAFLAIAMLLIIVGAVGLQVLRGVNERTEELIGLQRKIEAYRQVQHDTIGQLYSVSSALLSSDEPTLSRTLRQLNQLSYDVDRLQFVAKDEIELLGEFRQDYDRFVEIVTHGIEMIRAGRAAEAREIQTAAPLADRLERLTSQLVNKAEADMVAGIETSRQAYENSQWTVIAFALASIMLALALGYIISWSLIGPVKQIEAQLKQVAAGHFTHRVDVVNRDELGTLGADVNKMSEELGQLYQQLHQRTDDLSESLQQQTATADVLKVISRSTVDLETVLDTLVETAARLCRADHAVMFRRRDDMFQMVAVHGLTEEKKEFVRTHPLALNRTTLTGRVAMDRRVVHISDVLQDPEYTYHDGKKALGYRTMLGVPLLRDDELIGLFTINRTHVDPFTDKEIELATTFADQAVIAIENARLFEGLRDRQAELRVTFDNMGDGVVMFDAAARLTAWNRNFQEMLELPEAFLAGRPSFADYFRYLADRGEYVSADLEAQLGRTVEDTKHEDRFERTRPDGRVIEVRRNPVPGGAFVLIYSDITERKRAEEAIRAARDAAETALRELQTAQASLVHAQKMAALGQVTAGIAHEIKNPLNFVNNFAGLSVELLDELKEAARAVGALDPGKRAEILETIGMLTGNLEKIVEHGRRADGIVRSMLQHSRGGSGDRQATDLNALVEEALNLAYHGVRAQNPNFDITLERDLDRDLAPVDVVPQELTRVLLNLIGNGFYAANKRSGGGNGA